MKSKSDLKKLLLAIHRKSYPAYKDTRGSYQFGDYILNIEHVQGDPFASPSRVSILVPTAKAGFPRQFYQEQHRRIALQDYLLRIFGREIEAYCFQAKGSGKSGMIAVSRPGQEILERSACCIDASNGNLRIRLEIGFPANGRTINSHELIRIFYDFLPPCIQKTLFYPQLNPKQVASVIQLANDQALIRTQLASKGLVAFVANGAILPRESGVSSRPMKHAVPFSSPASLEVTMELSDGRYLTGMGIRKGISLIVGGGYHGKSTLLKALELGVYNHIAGDGREYVITDSSAVKIRAEDGRSIQQTDISMFIQNLPNKKDTHSFSTEDASGSTSQAANVIEAIEAGTSLFLIDEDTCATNFMIRDELMQKVVHRDQEPITPFIEHISDLFHTHGISCILVAGSSGAYFHPADCILQMDRYMPRDITAFAKETAAQFPLTKLPSTAAALPDFHRIPQTAQGFRKNDRIKMKTLGKDAFSIQRDTVDLRYVEQLVDSEQTTALAWILKYAQLHCCDGKKTLREVVDELMQLLQTKGFEALADSSYLSADLAMPRPQEVFACFNRYRAQNWKSCVPTRKSF